MLPNGMIDVRDAAKIAVEYCGQIFPAMARLRLEEVELSDDESHWFITVGFDDPLQSAVPVPPTSQNLWTEALYGLRPNPLGRQYKVVTPDAETGNVRSVKMRQPLERIS